MQRGVGTSQNGSAAFGASLNISTLDNRCGLRRNPEQLRLF
ncbi:MAG: hypothetical protein WKG07_19040 [Hymenobacter sp.]